MADNEHFDGRAGIDADLVKRLVRAQFPQWADLPVTPVKIDGWDNRTYRLGDAMTARLPTAASYAPAVEKEDRWLPILAPSLPVPVPVPLGLGQPGEGYPFHWSIRGWLDGESSKMARIASDADFAVAIASFILALQGCDTTDGPVAGAHSFYRGTSPSYYDDETRRALAALEGRIDTATAAAVWDAALEAKWDGPPTWFHGDISHGNLLVRDGLLSAVIDFGTSGVGDPSCELVIGLTTFRGPAQDAFRETVAHDAGMWARARGWALWKALIGLAAFDHNQQAASINHSVVDAVLADHARFG
ncbi:aminoglycoside phosphotransferase family protein [Tenggerimyces flavus]|uniref:Aminoglycoside phosphotransferase family protein n=1 Tax=Tenggerimyces flavus TaxID=1708749 RepID=A0ABV7YQ20_9ACTN|nr:aminoglycoside phosphotransferase family protein [Tenggerimyces flavus]MBM7785760.1 aminoglycoside phosphotransferase (APT) family kinase protein [Tenggerimyces flavus]